jgi:hypothetical protein
MGVIGSPLALFNANPSAIIALADANIA